MNNETTSLGYKIHKIRSELSKLLNVNKDFLDMQTTMIFGEPSLNIIKLDDWLISEHNYNIDIHGNQGDFIRKKFGKKAEQYINNLLNFNKGV